MMLSGEDDISYDDSSIFNVFFNVCLHSLCFAPIGGNLTVQSTGSHWGIGDKSQIPETLLQADCIFTKRKNLRFTGEEEKCASLVNMTHRLELSASHVAILAGNSSLITSYFEPCK